MAPTKQGKGRKSHLPGPSNPTDDAVYSTEDHIQLLVQKRSSIKAKLTRLSNYFHKAKDDHPNEATVIEMRTRLIDIESHLLKEFTEIQLELEHLDSDRFTEDELEQFEIIYFKTVSEIKQFLSCDTAPNHVQFQPSDSGIPKNKLNRPRANLPVIELPKFSGYFDKWLEFRDLYISLVHNNNYISPIEKFQYLKAPPHIVSNQ